jgi:hypothetical protein
MPALEVFALVHFEQPKPLADFCGSPANNRDRMSCLRIDLGELSACLSKSERAG